MLVVNVILKMLSSGSYVIIYIYANETFPTEDRNTGMGVCSAIARVGAIIGTFATDYLVSGKQCSIDSVKTKKNQIYFRAEHGLICQSYFMECHHFLLYSLLLSFQKHWINHCLKVSKMSNEWVWVGKRNKKLNKSNLNKFLITRSSPCISVHSVFLDQRSILKSMETAMQEKIFYENSRRMKLKTKMIWTYAKLIFNDAVTLSETIVQISAVFNIYSW